MAVVALMETPAIISGLLLARGLGGLRTQTSAGERGTSPRVGGHLAREVLLNGSVVVLVGAFVIGVISDGMVMCGVSEFWQMVIKGVVIILAVIVDQFQRNMEAKMALQARNEAKTEAGKEAAK